MTSNCSLSKLKLNEIVEIFISLEENGVTLEHLDWFRSDKTFAKSVCAFIANSSGKSASAVYYPVSSEFELKVNYDCSIEDACKDGNYEGGAIDFSSRNFSTTQKGIANVVLHIVHLDRYIFSKHVIEEMDKMGLRPAEIHELLALGAVYPDLQQEFPIIALGAVCQCEDKRFFAFLCQFDHKRHLCLSFDDSEMWTAGCRFAAVLK